MSQLASISVESAQINDSSALKHGWVKRKLGECVRLINGRAYSQHEMLSEGTPIIRIQNLNGGANWFYSTLNLPEDQYCNKGDLLFAWSASFGPYIWEGSKAIFHYHIWKVVPTEIIDKEFSYYLLTEITTEIRAASHGMAMLHMTKQKMESWEVLLPPLPEQKRIAAILKEQMSAVEGARAAAEVQLKAAKDLPAAYLREVFESSEASAWPKKQLGEVCEIVARQVDPKIPEYGALPHVNGENIESGTCRLKFLRTAAEDNMRSGKYLFEAGDVLYSKLRPYLRKVIVADFRGVCSADMYPIRVNPEFLNPHFTGWMLVSDEFTKYADEESRRARMPKLNREQLFAWEAPLPPLATQKLIIENLSEQMAKAERLVIKLQDQFDSINKLPAALSRQAFSGKL